MNWLDFFEEYDKCISKSIDDLIESVSDVEETESAEFMKRVFLNIDDKVEEWSNEKSAKLGGITPREMVDNISNAKEADEILVVASRNTDFDIPKFVTEKLKTFGEEEVELLMDLAFSVSWEAPDDPEKIPGKEHFVANTALKVLGGWKNKKALMKVSEKFSETDFPFEFMVDAFKDFISDFDKEAFLVLLNILNSRAKSGKDFSISHDYMLSFLVRVVPEGEEEKAFGCVRDCFRKMDNKLIGVIIIGELGNPRGITVLKSFISSGMADNDKELFYETLSSIESLGGDIEDIHDPFRDFA